MNKKSIKTHAEPLLSQLSHMDEMWISAVYKLGLSKTATVTPLSNDAHPSLIYCETILTHVSRSFAMVIQQLPANLRTTVCIFYLVLRGLDTVEDDMEAFKDRKEEKVQHLRKFHTYLTDPSFCLLGVGEGEETDLLANFGHVHAIFTGLPPAEQAIITDICKRMGSGMAAFAERDLANGTETLQDYNHYCHIVAGLVGEGLSNLFVLQGEDSTDLTLANDMGLFLQKTNIIRDYLEDLVEGRAFWPQKIWGTYATSLKEFSTLERPQAALECLNHMVADALLVVPSCIRYLKRLRSKDIFRFCAVPQVMAIATLNKLTNNPDVFTGIVKIRKGLALSLMEKATSMESVTNLFLTHARSIAAKVPRLHIAPYQSIQRSLIEIEKVCQPHSPPPFSLFFFLVIGIACICIIVIADPWVLVFLIAIFTVYDYKLFHSLIPRIG